MSTASVRSHASKSFIESRSVVIHLVIHLVIHRYLRHEPHRSVVPRPRAGLMREADAKEAITFVVEPKAWKGGVGVQYRLYRLYRCGGSGEWYVAWVQTTEH